MNDIKMNISKPYSREGTEAKQIQFEFSCLFDNSDMALDFQQRIGALVIEFRKGTLDAR